MPNFEIKDTREIDPAYIAELRLSVGWEEEEIAFLEEQLGSSLAVASAWNAGRLVGLGFLVGTRRHATIADVCVDPNNQNQGIGHAVVSALVSVARQKQVRYTRLSVENEMPFLESFYKKHGFVMDRTAMLLADPSAE